MQTVYEFYAGAFKCTFSDVAPLCFFYYKINILWILLIKISKVYKYNCPLLQLLVLSFLKFKENRLTKFSSFFTIVTY